MEGDGVLVVDGVLGGDSKKNEMKKKKNEKEGNLLLGQPKYIEIGNGRLRCKETGHELPVKEAVSYSRSKACRLALIDAAVSKKKPPLNTFHQCPLNKSKLVCDLTGDTINKSEEHIWKHITGKRFLNKLEQKEAEKQTPAEEEKLPVIVRKKDAKKSRELRKSSVAVVNDEQRIKSDGNASFGETPMENDTDLEELDFWVPPFGDRWDHDDGKDRWESCTSSDHVTDKESGPDEADDDQHDIESMSLSLSMKTKRMAIAVGPSSFASRKKKSKKVDRAQPDISCDM